MVSLEMSGHGVFGTLDISIYDNQTVRTIFCRPFVCLVEGTYDFASEWQGCRTSIAAFEGDITTRAARCMQGERLQTLDPCEVSGPWAFDFAEPSHIHNILVWRRTIVYYC